MTILQPTDYTITIDAGSTGTRLYIYSWPSRVNSDTPLVEPVLNSVRRIPCRTPTHSKLSTPPPNTHLPPPGPTQVTQKGSIENRTVPLASFNNNLDGVAGYVKG